MIKGLTHNAEDGVPNKVIKYKGKISTGYAPNEGPNQKNYPQAAGFFRVLKEVVKTLKIDGKNVAQKVWKLNDEIQKKLEESCGNQTPRKLDFMCMFKEPSQFWECSMAMYSSNEGLICKSFGEGTVAKKLKIGNDGERIWEDRLFDGQSGCKYKNCPDYIADKCKAIGLMKIFPLVDLSIQPYRFETRSINTIIGIESALDDMWNLSCAAHAVKQQEAGKNLKFDGLFGVQMSLIHRKVKSGGREVFITDLIASPEFSASVMAPIQRGIMKNQKLALTAGEEPVSLLSLTEEKQPLLPEIDTESVIDGDVDDQKEIAKQFGADAAETTAKEASETIPSLDKAAEQLLK